MNIHPAALQELVRTADTRLSREARQRVQWIAYFVTHGCDVEATCGQFKISRSTLHRWLERFDLADLLTLEERSHDSQTVRASLTPSSTIALVREERLRDPRIGKERIAAKLEAQYGIMISASSVGRIIERENLYFAATPLHWRKRVTSAGPRGAEHRQSSENSASRPQLWPLFWTRYGGRIKRSLLVGSIAGNIALVGLVLATALWEHNAAPNGRQTADGVRGTLSTQITSSALDLVAP